MLNSIINFIKETLGGGPSNVIHLNAKEFAAQIKQDKNAVVVDVRTTNEVKSGRIKGAKHMDIFSRDFGQKVAGLDKSKNYYVYCRSGARSNKACKIMQKAGIENTTNLKGGIMAWRGAKLHVSK